MRENGYSDSSGGLFKFSIFGHNGCFTVHPVNKILDVNHLKIPVYDLIPQNNIYTIIL